MFAVAANLDFACFVVQVELMEKSVSQQFVKDAEHAIHAKNPSSVQKAASTSLEVHPLKTDVKGRSARSAATATAAVRSSLSSVANHPPQPLVYEGIGSTSALSVKAALAASEAQKNQPSPEMPARPSAAQTPSASPAATASAASTASAAPAANAAPLAPLDKTCCPLYQAKLPSWQVSGVVFSDKSHIVAGINAKSSQWIRPYKTQAGAEPSAPSSPHAQGAQTKQSPLNVVAQSTAPAEVPAEQQGKGAGGAGAVYATANGQDGLQMAKELPAGNGTVASMDGDDGDASPVVSPNANSKSAYGTNGSDLRTVNGGALGTENAGVRPYGAIPTITSTGPCCVGGGLGNSAETKLEPPAADTESGGLGTGAGVNTGEFTGLLGPNALNQNGSVCGCDDADGKAKAQYEQVVYCPVEMSLSLLGGKYKSLILWKLLECGTLRFHQLRRLIPKATPKILTQQLRELEEHGLVRRTVYPVVPPKVEYSLTALGITIQPLLEAMYNWGTQYLKQLGHTTNCTMTMLYPELPKIEANVQASAGEPNQTAGDGTAAQVSQASQAAQSAEPSQLPIQQPKVK